MFPALRRTLSPLKLVLVLALISAGGCNLNTDVSLGPAGLFKSAGDGQTAAINTALPNPFSVTVVNQFGDLLSNTTVSWTVLSGGGTLSAATTQTDETGVATVIYTTGATTGQSVIRASVSDGLLVVTFTVTVT